MIYLKALVQDGKVFELVLVCDIQIFDMVLMCSW
jgi:hypothetical protein